MAGRRRRPAALPDIGLPAADRAGRIVAPVEASPDLAPGFLDLHVHGRAGRDFLSPDPETHRALARDLLALGTTGWLATFASAGEDELLRALEALRTARDADPVVAATCLGVHFEGPFLAPAKCGAQRPGTLRAPDPAMLARLLDAAAFAPRRLVTLAPELDGAEALLALIAARGDLVNLGHSTADHALAMRVIDRYRAGVTHLFNAMEPIHHRRPGLVTAGLLASPRVELIADGKHVDPAVLALSMAVLGERAVVVSDGHPLAGLPPGEYEHWDARYRVGAAGAGIAAGSTLGGSSATPLAMLGILVGPAGLSRDWALAAMTAAPARALGLEHERGRLVPGLRADFVVGLESDRPRGVFLGGERLV